MKKQKQKEIEIETENNSILRKLRSQTIKKKRKKHWMGPKMKQNLLYVDFFKITLGLNEPVVHIRESN